MKNFITNSKTGNGSVIGGKRYSSRKGAKDSKKFQITNSKGQINPND
ncbi:MAG: hypothetical protein AB1422_09350 [bacterium]